MKNLSLHCIVFCSFLGLSMLASAKDDVTDFSISDALETEKAKEVLGNDVRFYFGTQGHPASKRKYGTFQANKKTNAVGKSDERACNWAFLSAMKSLRQRALREGGNAVINIKSNYRNNLTSSNTTFKCGVGNIMVGVTLKGTVVRQ